MLRRMYEPPAGNVEDSHVASDGMSELKSDYVDDCVRYGLVDLSCLYQGWSCHRWTKLHQLISRARCGQLQLCWVCVHREPQKNLP